MWGNPTLFLPRQKYLPKTVSPKVQYSWSGEILKVLKSKTVNAELFSLCNLCKNKLFGKSADLKSAFIPCLINLKLIFFMRKLFLFWVSSGT